jgi:hypothetical protein
MHLFVFLPFRGAISKYSYADIKKRLNFQTINNLAPGAKYFNVFEDNSRHKFATLCESIDNEMKDALIFEVEDDAEAKALLDNIDKLTITENVRHGSYNYYRSYYDLELRYVFKDIDYDRMSTQAVFEILSKSEDKEKEKIEQKVKIKRLGRLKKAMDSFVSTFNLYTDLTTDEFKKTVAQLNVDFNATHDEIKNEVAAERKEANKNKVSIRQKLSKFAVYNSRSKK